MKSVGAYSLHFFIFEKAMIFVSVGGGKIGKHK